MRGLSSYLAGIALLALAFWAFSKSGMSTAAVTFAATAAFFFVRGSQGREASAAGDFTAPMDFIANPAGAIVDSAVDQFRDMLAAKEDDKADHTADVTADEKRREPAPSAALEAALARHIEKQQEAVAPAGASAPERRVFGRKGL